MKNRFILHSLAITITMLMHNLGASAEVVGNPQPGRTEQRIPLIVIENVPLTDAIRNLARQVDLNFILDPRILGPAGIFPAEPPVSYRWENLSAEEALRRVLKDHKLKMVMSPATSVARITGTNQAVTPVPLTCVGTDTNNPIPLLQMDAMPVSDAIKQVSRQVGLNILFAPDAQAALDNPGGSHEPARVTVRWKNITPRQALAALLDNYDLVLIEDASKPIGKIALKTPRR